MGVFVDGGLARFPRNFPPVCPASMNVQQLCCIEWVRLECGGAERG